MIGVVPCSLVGRWVWTVEAAVGLGLGEERQVWPGLFGLTPFSKLFPPRWSAEGFGPARRRWGLVFGKTQHGTIANGCREREIERV